MERTAVLEDLILFIRAAVPEIRLCKAYEGEFQGGAERFLRAVNGILPCALSVCEQVEAVSDSDIRITVSLLIATSDFTGADHIPAIYRIADKMITEIHGYNPRLPEVFDWWSFLSERHVAHSDFFTLYEQRYAINHLIRTPCERNNDAGNI